MFNKKYKQALTKKRKQKKVSICDIVLIMLVCEVYCSNKEENILLSKENGQIDS
jgi:hypothetical protein